MPQSEWRVVHRTLRPHVRTLAALIPITLIGLTACSSDNTGPAAPASVSVFSGNTPVDSVGGTLTDSAVVVVRDQNGNPVPNVAVNWAAGGGTVDSNSTTTNSQGHAQVKWTFTFSPTAQAGTTTASLTATVTGLTPATFTATAGPGNPNALVITTATNNQTGNEGQTLGDSLVVEVTDQHGFPVPHATVTWTAIAGSGSLSATRGSAGIATLTTTTGTDGTTAAFWTLGTTIGVNTVNVTTSTTQGTIGPVQFTATGH